MKSCKNCKAYKRLNTKFCNRLYCSHSYSHGYYCTVREEAVQAEYCCPLWQRQKAEYDLTAQRFDEIERDLLYLCKHLKEE